MTVPLLQYTSTSASATAKQTRSKATCYRYGIWGDWDEPYLTLDPAYEAAQLKVFGKMVLNGHIYRGRKPVHWSPSSRTALAESELEYPEGHVSPSIYVALPIDQTGNGQTLISYIHTRSMTFLVVSFERTIP